jgi:helix-turn-helix protein
VFQLIEIMNELAEPNGNNNRDLDVSHFNPEEQIMAKLIITKKGREGLHARLIRHGIHAFSGLVEEFCSGDELTQKINEYLVADTQFEHARKKIADYESRVYNEIANALGITSEKMYEIKDYVYKHERSL